MTPIPAAEVDAWLRAGGMVVASSDRAARAVRAAFHRARRAEGLRAWPAPQVLDWQSFVRAEWARRAADERLVLNAVQERSLWSQIVGGSGHTANWLPGPRQRIADLAMEARDLLCSYAPSQLRDTARQAWQQDAAAFSEWLKSFDQLASANGLASGSRLPLELLRMLEDDDSERPALVLAGFDRVLPVQQRIFEAWGETRLIAAGEPEAVVNFYAAGNEDLELTACARWCRRQLEANPHAKLLVIAHDAAERRGEIERAFLKHVGAAQPARFEFSLGIPLGKVGLARTASLLLHWLDGALDEVDVDWLIASGAAADAKETAALQSYMRGLRHRGLERTRWTLEAFLRQPVAAAAAQTTWAQRITSAQRRLKGAGPMQSPLEWAALSTDMLETTGWPGTRQLTSAEFQAANRWQQAVDLCGSLAFDERRIAWTEFLSELDRTLGETLFAEESHDAPILIAGPAESAGLNANATWFLGGDEGMWPAGGTTNPLLPIEVQREARMPHASPQLDWELADSITRRLLSSSPHVCFSYARLKDDVEQRPSRLLIEVAGPPQPLPREREGEVSPGPRTAMFEDTPRIPFPAGRRKKATAQLSLFEEAEMAQDGGKSYEVQGGSTVLTSQSQCAFKAFATSRLAAQGWEPAQTGLTAAQRGQLLHAVLHSVWGPPPLGIRTSNQLQVLGADLRSFVENHVRRVLQEEMPAGAREQMPARYLELEKERLTRLVTEWLDYERTRVPFEVEATEVKESKSIAGLRLNLRLDRVDRLIDGSLLVVDYKSGNVTPNSWELPRPDDIQLPLYAEFALPVEDRLGGLVFAKVRPGNMCFAGKVADAAATLDSTLKGNAGLLRNPLTADQLTAWKEAIEQLARDFVEGRADVDPRDYPATCERCGLFALCRVSERDDELEPEEDETGVEAGDE